MAITTLSMVLTVFVLNLHHVTDKPVPPLVKKIVFLYMAPLLGMCSLADSVGLGKSSSAKRSQTYNNRRGQTNAVAQMNTNFIPLDRRPSSYNNGDGDPEHRRTDSIPPATMPTLPPVSDGHHIGQHIRCSENGGPNGIETTELMPNMKTRMEPRSSPMLSARDYHFGSQGGVGHETLPPPAPPTPNDYSKDWKQMAEVFDRLFFWVFFLAISISTLVLFHPLTKSFTDKNSTGAQQQQLQEQALSLPAY